MDFGVFGCVVRPGYVDLVVVGHVHCCVSFVFGRVGQCDRFDHVFEFVDE